MGDRHVIAEQERRNPDPIFSQRTEEQVKSDLSALKCQDESNKWGDVVVVETGNDQFDVVPKVTVGARVEDPDDLPDVVYGKGKQLKTLSPYAQVFSWLRTNNWNLRDDQPNVLEWVNGELRQGLGGVRMTTTQRNGLPGSLRRFSVTLGKSAGLQDAFSLFTEYLKTNGLLTGVGSLLPEGTGQAFRNHLCPFAQCVKVTKFLYVQVFIMQSKIKEVESLAQCNPPSVDEREFLKRLRGVWGLFHRLCMPAIIYLRAWMEYFGVRLHGSPYGPLFFYNLWAWYVRNALKDVVRKRRKSEDVRKRLQDTSIVDFALILDPTALQSHLQQKLVAAAGEQRAEDVWDPSINRPNMPGPPPEFTSTLSLQSGWTPYLESLPQQWKRWLGTSPARSTRQPYRYRQYNLVNGRLRITRGDDPVQAVMFRDSGLCLVDVPARRRPIRPPRLRPIALTLFRPAVNAQQQNIVEEIALGGIQQQNPQGVVVQRIAAGGNENPNEVQRIAIGRLRANPRRDALLRLLR